MAKKSLQMEVYDGTALTIRALPQSSLALVQKSIRGRDWGLPPKPEPPSVVVGTQGGEPKEELNADDPDYKSALAEWRLEQTRVISEQNSVYYQFVTDKAVVDEPPDEWLEDNDIFLVGLTDKEKKLQWLVEICGGEEGVAEITQIALAARTATEEVVQEMIKTFRADDRRNGSDGVSVPGSEGGDDQVPAEAGGGTGEDT